MVSWSVSAICGSHQLTLNCGGGHIVNKTTLGNLCPLRLPPSPLPPPKRWRYAWPSRGAERRASARELQFFVQFIWRRVGFICFPSSFYRDLLEKLEMLWSRWMGTRRGAVEKNDHVRTSTKIPTRRWSARSGGGSSSHSENISTHNFLCVISSFPHCLLLRG